MPPGRRRCGVAPAGLLAALAGGPLVLAAPPVDLFGVCYAPVPLNNPDADLILDDDFMSEDARPLWGMRGRDDLTTIRNLGATAVRLYGNNPTKNHESFLSEALARGLGVIPGISDYPYTQMQGNCNATSGGNCYTQVRAAYLGNLQQGFLTRESRYHPALKHIVIINEPDMKIGVSEEQAGKRFAPHAFALAVISAADAMLDAEKVANVTGPLVNFTATVAFAQCSECLPLVGGALNKVRAGVGFALAQMLVLQMAFLNPQAFNYTPRNDLATFYWTRFINSFNTQNDATYVRDTFVVYYASLFPRTPFFIEEYHNPDYNGDIRADVDLLREISLHYSGELFYGFNFFEFQKRYDKQKPGEERFGMFALGTYQMADVTLGRETFPVLCLEGIPNVKGLHGDTLPQAVAKAFRGPGIRAKVGCAPDPALVPLNDTGYAHICALRDPEKVKLFVERVILHMGGVVVSQDVLESKAAQYCTERPRLQGENSLVADLTWIREHRWEPSMQWVRWELSPVCAADEYRGDINAVGRAVDEQCKVIRMDCGNMPAKCLNSTWSKGDYIFSYLYAEKAFTAGSDNPVANCYFNGAATLKPNAYLNERNRGCVITRDPETTAVTAEGWLIMKAINDPKKTRIFLKRVVEEELHSVVYSTAELEKYAEWAWMVKDWDELLLQLRWKAWVCGEGVKRRCDDSMLADLGPKGKYAWLWLPLSMLLGCIMLASLTACLYVALTQDKTVAWFNKQRDLRWRSYEDGSSESE